MWNFKINKNKCIQCGMCVAECSRKCLEMNNSGVTPREDAGERCFHCLHCVAICPQLAVEIDGITPQMCTEVSPQPSEYDMLRLIKSRRSCRIFREENLPEDTINKLIEMLAYPPTGVNCRSLHFSIVDNVDKMNQLRDYTTKKMLQVLNQNPIAPEAARFAMFKRAFERGINPIFRNAPHMIVITCPPETPCAEIDPAIALSYFELYAQTLGVATLWCGMAKWLLDGSCRELLSELKVPPENRFGYVMLFGPPLWYFPRAVLRKVDTKNLVRIGKE